MKNVAELERTNEELRRRLAEAEEALRAIRDGEVDAIVVHDPRGPQVYSLTGAETVYRLAVETMAEAAINTTPKGRILYCNARFVEFVGAPMQDVIGRELAEFVPPEARPALSRLLADCAHHPVKARVVLRSQEGRLTPTHLTGRALLQEGETSLCLVATDLSEIENSTKLLAALRASEQKLRRVLETDQVAVLFFDDQGTLIGANDVFVRMTGYSHEQIGRRELTWRSLTPPEWIGLSERQIEQFRRTRRIGPYEKEYFLADGSRRWMRFSGRDLEDGTIVEFCIDISEQKAAEQELADREQRLRLAMKAGRAGTWEADVLTGQLTASERALSLHGLTPAAPLHLETAWQTLHPEDRPSVETALRHTLVTGEPFRVELRALQPDGSLRWLLSQAELRVGSRRPRLIGLVQDITERKEAEERLRLSEAKYRNLFLNMTEEVCYWQVERDASGAIVTWRLVDANPPALRSWGFQTIDAVRWKTVDEIFGPGTCERQRPLVQRIFADGQPVLHEEYLADLDRHCNVTCVPFGDSFITTGADVTDTKKAELALRRSHETFYGLVNNAPLGVYVVDGQFRLTHVSAGAQAVFRNVRPLIGHDLAAALRQIWPEPFASDVIARFHRTFETGTPYVAPSLTLRRQDTGEMESYEWQLHRITMPDGTFGVVCYYFESTSIRRVEQAVRESEERFRQLADSMPQVVWVANAAGRVRYHNSRASGIAGRVPSNSHAWDWTSAVHADDLPGTRAAWHAALQSQAPFEFEHRLRMTDGSTRWHLSRAAPKLSGAEVRWYGTATDIEHQKQVEVDLRQHRENLQRLVDERTTDLRESMSRLADSERLAALGNLAAGLGHDLANMLLPIRMRLDPLAASVADESMRSDLKAIGQSLDHVSKLSAGLRLMALDPTRESASAPVRDIAEWWMASEAVFRNALPRTSQLQCRIPGVAPLQDSTKLPGLGIAGHRLTQAVFNLVQNAGEALDHLPRGMVVVSAERLPNQPGHIAIRVEDNGPGIAKEHLPRIFEPYFTTKGRAIATGMGLGMVRGVVESAGGTVEVRSRPGQGATFTLVVPVLRDGLADSDATSRSDVRRAVVSLPKERERALAHAVLMGLGVEVVDGPEPTPPVELWVVQTPPSHAIDAYLHDDEHRRLVLVGGPPVDPRGGRVVQIQPGFRPSEFRDALVTAACPRRPSEVRRHA